MLSGTRFCRFVEIGVLTKALKKPIIMKQTEMLTNKVQDAPPKNAAAAGKTKKQVRAVIIVSIVSPVFISLFKPSLLKYEDIPIFPRSIPAV
jgi:hypothetical protein